MSGLLGFVFWGKITGLLRGFLYNRERRGWCLASSRFDQGFKEPRVGDFAMRMVGVEGLFEWGFYGA